MARPSAVPQLVPSLSELSSPPTHEKTVSSHDITQQIARVDASHARLKAETVRCQEMLVRLHRDEHNVANATQPKANSRTIHQEETAKHNEDTENEHRDGHRPERKETSKPATMKSSQNALHPLNQEVSGNREQTERRSDGSCRCQCSHHPWSPTSDAVLRKAAEKYNPSLNVHTHVDEREVRDLEKRVRGLEGRVKGFEGLPPDREMALMEVDRLRRELEGLARRREGLFEGLSAEFVDNVPAKMLGKPAKGAGKPLSHVQGNGKMNTTGKTVSTGKK